MPRPRILLHVKFTKAVAPARGKTLFHQFYMEQHTPFGLLSATVTLEDVPGRETYTDGRAFQILSQEIQREQSSRILESAASVEFGAGTSNSG